MSYVLLDDGFHSNPKIVKAGLPAAGLYARALSYCGDYLTDGYIPQDWLLGAAGKDGLKVVNELLKHGLMKRKDDGFHIPDYLEYNASKKTILAKRAEKAKAGKKGATKRWGDGSTHSTDDDTSDDTSHGDSDGNPNGEPIARARGLPTPTTNANSNTSSSSVSENPSLPSTNYLTPARDRTGQVAHALGGVDLTAEIDWSQP